jgi:hypothetical protein
MDSNGEFDFEQLAKKLRLVHHTLTRTHARAPGRYIYADNILAANCARYVWENFDL